MVSFLQLTYTRLVEEKTAKFQVVLNAELPLKFNLRAQLPSGEIVPVSLEYVNLHRWCHSCRLISHEVDTCPLLTEEQREHHRQTKENNRDQGQQSRLDSTRKGDLSKRLNVAGQKPQSYLERRSGDGTQRDNRDSVWKRIDSRYAPRDDHREKNRQAPRDRDRDRDILPPSKETYNKRRYDDSFAASRQREETRRAERKHVPTAQSTKGERAPEGSEDDWIINGETFDVDEDDLMDEDELLYDENHKEGEFEQTMASNLMDQTGESSIGMENNLKETMADETLNQLGGIAIGPSSSRDHQSPSHPLQSPLKKKKGSPIFHAAGLSLRKRNMLKGRASPKFKEAKDGPSMGFKPSMARSEKMDDGGKEEGRAKTKTKTAKVGSKPPKIPR
ncbi:hypothetical protein IGI04_022336 [Brassica rapa subsp. trilocularis]|uniref:Zinc knuckle CX2CX4HX4C domain-containing protein n=1 Tax=Brassica rapa subsp. trilocularis TaxID=1813537 RepID=A0ABQ7M0N7_BRACM|nr:hypothetical protein IGI04_022336 [Brassica rapa subsp. trilocularis]